MVTTELSNWEVVNSFQRLAFSAEQRGMSWGAGTYFGLRFLKWPCDTHLYQELIWDIKPQLIIETGTYRGASALFFAHLLDQIGWGKIASIDVEPVTPDYPRHPRISYFGGRSSTDPAVAQEVDGLLPERGHVMVILDSDHSKEHVSKELDIYHRYVTPGSYLVVEDINLGTELFRPEDGPGAQAALDDWLPKHKEYRPDKLKASKYLFSTNAWLRKVIL